MSNNRKSKQIMTEVSLWFTAGEERSIKQMRSNYALRELEAWAKAERNTGNIRRAQLISGIATNLKRSSGMFDSIR